MVLYRDNITVIEMADTDTVKQLNDFSDWVREHRTLAILGGFAIGVFFGVLARR